MRSKKIIITVLLTCLLIASSCTINKKDKNPIYIIQNNGSKKTASIPMIKVLLNQHKGKKHITLKISQKAEFFKTDEDESQIVIKSFPDIIELDATPAGFSMKGENNFSTEILSDYFRVTVPDSKINLTFSTTDELTILGELVVSKSKEDKEIFDIIVRTDLETYCAQVLFNEMPESFDKEALKAQSVATRTYALFKIMENSPKERTPWAHDLVNTQQDTVFNPSLLSSNAQQICQATFGEVITAKDMDGNPRIFPAYYHSTCGGATASAWDAQGTYKNLEPLQGVDTDFCMDSPVYTWKRTYSWLTWREMLIAKEFTTENMAKTLKSLEVSEKDRFGRARRFKFSFEGQSDFDIQAIVFRNKVVGPGKTEGQLPSVFITSIKITGDIMEIEGKGWGHGCGLCQWGANKLSKDGKDYQEILKMYYPGADIWGYYK
ncbi:MAG: SpoIID/LytB domain-containing protein [Planctomycetes bacterium]|nr:SpoIID/LytB domain-containing protein [Planctomycetota bacterium]